MLINQHVSRQEMDGYDLFRIHDIVNDKLTNLRAVRKTGDTFTLLLTLTEAEAAFIYDEADIHLYQGPDTDRVLETLRTQEKAVETNIHTILRVSSYVDADSIETRTVAGHTYAISENDVTPTVPRVDYTFGDADGRIIQYGPIPEEQSLEALLLSLLTVPYSEAAQPIYQIGASEYITVVPHDEFLVSVPLFLHREEGGQLGWASDGAYFRYFHRDADGHMRLVSKPDTMFPEEADLQAFLEAATVQATATILRP